jgi:GT2 family glycosyltransferase
VRREALERIGGFDTSIEFHGEDTNIGRRLFAVGRSASFTTAISTPRRAATSRWGRAQ